MPDCAPELSCRRLRTSSQCASHPAANTTIDRKRGSIACSVIVTHGLDLQYIDGRVVNEGMARRDDGGAERAGGVFGLRNILDDTRTSQEPRQATAVFLFSTGAIAQLVERCNRTAEVRSSTLLSSTSKIPSGKLEMSESGGVFAFLPIAKYRQLLPLNWLKERITEPCG